MSIGKLKTEADQLVKDVRKQADEFYERAMEEAAANFRLADKRDDPYAMHKAVESLPVNVLVEAIRKTTYLTLSHPPSSKEIATIEWLRGTNLVEREVFTSLHEFRARMSTREMAVVRTMGCVGGWQLTLVCGPTSISNDPTVGEIRSLCSVIGFDLKEQSEDSFGYEN